MSIERIQIIGQRPAANPLFVSCASSACVGVAQDFARELQERFRENTPHAPSDEQVVENFCELLVSGTPSFCQSYLTNQYWPGGPSYFSHRYMNVPPLTNGCGRGGVLEIAAVAILDFYNLEGFSGDVNSPRAGKDFTNACNNHDVCYAGSGGKTGCDDIFFAQMSAVCSGDSKCTDFAHAYRGAVGAFGHNAKQQAEQQTQCRAVKEDVNNNCPA